MFKKNVNAPKRSHTGAKLNMKFRVKILIIVYFLLIKPVKLFGVSYILLCVLEFFTV